MAHAAESEIALDNQLDIVDVVHVIQRSLGAQPDGSPRPAEIVEALRRNKVPLLSLARSPDSRLPNDVRVLLETSAFGDALVAEQARYAEAHAEYVQLVQAWDQHGLRCLCFKSAGIAPSFPYTSDNVDLLVPADQAREARRVLVALGYVEMTNTEEPRKWLFRRFVAGRNVSVVHLHAHIAWDEGFMLEPEVWHRARQAPDDPWVRIPGREDAVLINLAHALIENKELSLHDLLKVRCALRGGEVEWEYLDHVAAERGWRDCLCLGLTLVAQLEEQLFNTSVVPVEQRARWERDLRESRWLNKYRERLRGEPPSLPFRISFAVSKVLFFEKLWRDRHLAGSRKPAQTVLALTRGLKERSRLHLQNSMLITLSGVDGGGKSSHALALRDAFDAGHVKSAIVWTRIGDTPALRLLRRARKRYDASKGVTTQRAFSRAGWRLALWALVASADYSAWLQYVRWQLLRGNVVIADRYLSDFDVELGIRLRNEPHLAAALLRLLHLVAPRPQRSYLLKIDPALSRTRKPESDFRDLDPADMERRYDALVGRYGLKGFDASRDFDELATALVIDAMTTYMVNFRQLLRLVLFSNPRQLNPGTWHREFEAPGGKAFRPSQPSSNSQYDGAHDS